MTHAAGTLADTLTYHDRRWFFMGHTEPADGVLIVQQYRGSRAEVDRYRVEEQPAMGAMGRAFIVKKDAGQPKPEETLKDIAKRPVEKIYQTVIGPVNWCQCTAANTRCSNSCKHRDCLAAMIADGVI